MHIRECFKLGSILDKLFRARNVFIYMFIGGQSVLRCVWKVIKIEFNLF